MKLKEFLVIVIFLGGLILYNNYKIKEIEKSDINYEKGTTDITVNDNTTKNNTTEVKQKNTVNPVQTNKNDKNTIIKKEENKEETTNNDVVFNPMEDYSNNPLATYLNNIDNWRAGLMYKYYGATPINNANNFAGNTEKIPVQSNALYYISVTDSNTRVSIYEFDANDKNIAITKELYDGDTIKVNENTSYIKIAIYNVYYSSLDLYNFIKEKSLVVNIATSYSRKSMEIVKLSTANFKSTNNLIKGRAGTVFGATALSKNELVYYNMYMVDTFDSYVVNTPNSYITLGINEFSHNHEYIKTVKLANGKKYTPSENCKYISIYYFENSSSVSYSANDILSYVKNNNKSVLTKYKKYNHNTKMNGMTSFDFVSSMNVGWNLGNSLGTSPTKTFEIDGNLDQEVIWGNPYVTKDLIDFVASLGFNTIRIPVTFYGNCGRDANGNLIVGKEFLSRVQDVIDYALQNNLYVVMDTMGDGISKDAIFYVGVKDTKEWQKVKNDAYNLWYQVATYFKDYDERLVFEAYNELSSLTVGGGGYDTLSMDQMNELNQIFINAVRASGGNNASRILAVQPFMQSSRENFLSAFVLPKDTIANRIIVSVHGYEDSWEGSTEWKFEMLESFSKKWNVPIIITEFGMNKNATPINYREENYTDYIARAQYHGIKCFVWDDGGNWKIVDRYNFNNTNYSIIKAIFDGVNGKTYSESEDVVIKFDEITDYEIGAISLQTGNISYTNYSKTHWFELVPRVNGDYHIKIPNGVDYITLDVVNKNINGYVWIYGATFYDENLNVISYNTYKNPFHTHVSYKVPNNAKYISWAYYDPSINWTGYETANRLLTGDLSASMTFINSNTYTLKASYIDTDYDYSKLGYRSLNKKNSISYKSLEEADTSYTGWIIGKIDIYGSKKYAKGSSYVLDYYKTVSKNSTYLFSSTYEDTSFDISEFDSNFNSLGVVSVKNNTQYKPRSNAKYVLVQMNGINSDVMTSNFDSNVTIKIKKINN